jgi:aspartyl-tRNA synthetase
MAIICGAPSIKDVIAFPKSLGGADPLFKSPSTVRDEVLEWYSLRKARGGDVL